jgi:predicted ferric reductase
MCVAAFTVVAVFALWLHGGNLQAVGAGGGDAWISAGRLTGLISADMLLIQVFVMARIPWVERAYGHDRLARWHRFVGFTSINLMLLHIVLIVIGYAADDRAPLFGETWQLVTTYPGMLLATAATVALIMVVVTSVRAARTRLRYESWHLLHLYAYLGVGLSLPHELWTGADFVSTGPARVYWWTIYIIAAGSIVVFRIGLPLWRSVRHDLRVDAIVAESPGVTSIHLRGRDLDRMPVRSGQFFNWRFLGGHGWTRAHPYSLSAAPRSDLLRITVKDLGDGSSALPRLTRGMRVLVEGPYGRLTGAVRQRHRLTLIASGIGITPMRALLESEHYRPGEAVLIYRASTPADFTFYREIEWLVRARGVRVTYLPGPRGAGPSWLPAGHEHETQALRLMAPDIARSDVFICGPQPWMESVIESVRQAAVPANHIHLERFGW